MINMLCELWTKGDSNEFLLYFHFLKRLFLLIVCMSCKVIGICLLQFLAFENKQIS